MVDILNVDLDGTLAHRTAALVDRVNKDTEHFPNASLSREYLSEYYFTVPGTEDHPKAQGDDGVSIGTVINHYLTQEPDYIQGMPPIDGSVEVMQALAESDYYVQIVTHRPPETHDESIAWLDRHDIPYDNFVEDVPPNKAQVEGDILIDDHAEHTRDMVHTGKKAIPILHPYSVGCLPYHESVICPVDSHPNKLSASDIPPFDDQWKAIHEYLDSL